MDTGVEVGAALVCGACQTNFDSSLLMPVSPNDHNVAKLDMFNHAYVKRVATEKDISLCNDMGSNLIEERIRS